MKNGKNILEDLEKHCEEHLNCSRRLRLQIEGTINRLIYERDGIKTKVLAIFEGHDVYDPKTQKTIFKNK